jgi:hypothetical protein
MPGGRGKRGNPETIGFMQLVMDRVGVTTATELANLLISEGIFTPGEHRKILGWCAGTHAPEHASTVKLMNRAGLS